MTAVEDSWGNIMWESLTRQIGSQAFEWPMCHQVAEIGFASSAEIVDFTTGSLASFKFSCQPRLHQKI